MAASIRAPTEQQVSGNRVGIMLVPPPVGEPAAVPDLAVFAEGLSETRGQLGSGRSPGQSRMRPGTLNDPQVGAKVPVPRASRLVTDSRGMGPIRRLLLGSVGQAVLRRPPCAAAIVQSRY